ncbi:MAG: AAA family ATPase [Flavobacteriales bacterium]|nr:AAA family ATPase [Flavobacteriales bacterium]
MNCNQCGSALPAEAKFCPNCGAKTAAGITAAHAQPAERKQLTVLFSDLAGSTPLSERLDPEDLREVLRDYQSLCNSVMKRYDGYVAKFLGDGVLAYFGYPESHEDDARRGVSAGIAIVEAMRNHSAKYEKRFGVRTDVRVGVHTGLVVVGDMGGEGLEADSIVGKTPNLAARIQGAAALNTVAISSDTFKLVERYFDCKDLGEHELKGIAQPVRLHQALLERAAATRLEVIGDLTPFTGRAAEIEQLTQQWKKADQGAGQVAVVGGEAGVGKSRILLAMKELAAAQAGAWLTELRCSQYHINSSFYPVIDFLERVVLQFHKDDGPEARMQKLEGWLAQYGMDTATMVPLLAGLLSIPLSAGHVPVKLTPVKQKERTIELRVSILIRRAEQQPVLFVMEDVHWADPSTLELLDRVITSIARHRILLLLSHRPSFVPPWKVEGNVARIELTGLPRTDAEGIIRKAAKGKKLPDEVVKYIVDRTDGVPLFLEELTRMMIENDMLRATGDRYELVAPLEKLPIPATLQDSLAARLDRLKEAKPVAQLAATIGREFTYGMMEAIPGPHREDLTKHLARMVDAGLVFKHEEVADTHYTFKHALIQDTAYNSLLKSSRREFHKAIAGSFEAGQATLVDAHPELIAHHYTEAEMPLQAMAAWQKAGQLAIGRAAMPEAINHLTKAVEQSALLPDGAEKLGGELMAQTFLGLANMQRWGYGHPDVEKAFTRARDLCRVMGDPPQIFPVLHGLVKFRLVRGEYHVGLELARQLQATAEASGDTELLIEALYTVGAALAWMGDGAALPALERLIAAYDPVAHAKHGWIYGEDPYVAGYGHSFWLRAVRGWPETAMKEVVIAEKRAKELEHPWTTDYLHACKSQMVPPLRDYARTEEYSKEFLDSALEHGFPWWVAAASVNLGWAMAHRGEVAEGLEMATRSAAMWRMMGAELAVPSFYLHIAEIHLLDGNPSEALKFLDEGLEIIAKTGERLYEAELHRVRGEALVVLDRKEEALANMVRAIEVALELEHNLWLIRAATGHTRLSKRLGVTPIHLDTLAKVHEWFTEARDGRDVTEAGEVLKEFVRV